MYTKFQFIWPRHCLLMAPQHLLFSYGHHLSHVGRILLKNAQDLIEWKNIVNLIRNEILDISFCKTSIDVGLMIFREINSSNVQKNLTVVSYLILLHTSIPQGTTRPLWENTSSSTWRFKISFIHFSCTTSIT